MNRKNTENLSATWMINCPSETKDRRSKTYTIKEVNKNFKTGFC